MKNDTPQQPGRDAGIYLRRVSPVGGGWSIQKATTLGEHIFQVHAILIGTVESGYQAHFII